MGIIISDVIARHLRVNGEEDGVIKAIAHHFNINYARTIRWSGTTVSAYLIHPDRQISQAFGFTEELLMILSRYEKRASSYYAVN